MYAAWKVSGIQAQNFLGSYSKNYLGRDVVYWILPTTTTPPFACSAGTLAGLELAEISCSDEGSGSYWGRTQAEDAGALCRLHAALLSRAGSHRFQPLKRSDWNTMFQSSSLGISAKGF